MKKIIFIAALLVIGIGAKAQNAVAIKPTDTAKLYNPAADAKTEIADAVKKASAEHKNVLLQIGGNWCIWCIRFNDLVTKDPDLNKYLRDNFVVLHVNYSKENTNEKLLAELGYPQRFGFPVFIVLDDKGNRIHTQNSGYLEEGKGHSKDKVMEFFKDWSPAAIDPKSYQASK
ncbi:thioredoxin-like protein [Mucilaginibacter frigoritolerans]|jgi:thioredoxin-related protein|uniref:Thioredoxin-like protein n=1 Tax=Mucilaginibacter frigoritolerans TaxID=652788 RepID=A0A562UBX6_9SPHI|nr:thioredoxin family protein [Mucilaginibacter frigoritolerans]TWJ03258.1 thioredoxin-like protein [Mucilaginibacter frigoritolerans]